MVCVGEGQLLDGMRQRDGFLDGVRRLGMAFRWYASEGWLFGGHRCETAFSSVASARDGLWRASVWDGVCRRCVG